MFWCFPLDFTLNLPILTFKKLIKRRTLFSGIFQWQSGRDWRCTGSSHISELRSSVQKFSLNTISACSFHQLVHRYLLNLKWKITFKNSLNISMLYLLPLNWYQFLFAVFSSLMCKIKPVVLQGISQYFQMKAMMWTKQRVESFLVKKLLWYRKYTKS